MPDGIGRLCVDLGLEVGGLCAWRELLVRSDQLAQRNRKSLGRDPGSIQPLRAQSTRYAPISTGIRSSRRTPVVPTAARNAYTSTPADTARRNALP